VPRSWRLKLKNNGYADMPFPKVVVIGEGSDTTNPTEALIATLDLPQGAVDAARKDALSRCNRQFAGERRERYCEITPALIR